MIEVYPPEASQAELEALERDPIRSPKKKAKRTKSKGKPRDELGRFAPKKKSKAKS